MARSATRLAFSSVEPCGFCGQGKVSFLAKKTYRSPTDPLQSGYTPRGSPTVQWEHEIRLPSTTLFPLDQILTPQTTPLPRRQPPYPADNPLTPQTTWNLPRC